MNDETLLAILNEMRDDIRILRDAFERFRPLLDRYEQAKNANGMLAQRRALLGKERNR